MPPILHISIRNRETPAQILITARQSLLDVAIYVPACLAMAIVTAGSFLTMPNEWAAAFVDTIQLGPLAQALTMMGALFIAADLPATTFTFAFATRRRAGKSRVILCAAALAEILITQAFLVAIAHHSHAEAGVPVVPVAAILAALVAADILISYLATRSTA